MGDIDWHVRFFTSLDPQQVEELKTIRRQVLNTMHESTPEINTDETHFIMMAGEHPFGSLSVFKHPYGHLLLTTLYVSDDQRLRRDFARRFGENHHSPTTELLAQAVSTLPNPSGILDTTGLLGPSQRVVKRLIQRIPGLEADVRTENEGFSEKTRVRVNYAKARERLKPVLELRR